MAMVTLSAIEISIAIMTTLVIETIIHDNHNHIGHQNQHSYDDCIGHQNQHLSFWNQTEYQIQKTCSKVASEALSILVSSM